MIVVAVILLEDRQPALAGGGDDSGCVTPTPTNTATLVVKTPTSTATTIPTRTPTPTPAARPGLTIYHPFAGQILKIGERSEVRWTVRNPQIGFVNIYHIPGRGSSLAGQELRLISVYRADIGEFPISSIEEEFSALILIRAYRWDLGLEGEYYSQPFDFIHGTPTPTGTPTVTSSRSPTPTSTPIPTAMGITTSVVTTAFRRVGLPILLE